MITYKLFRREFYGNYTFFYHECKCCNDDVGNSHSLLCASSFRFCEIFVEAFAPRFQHSVSVKDSLEESGRRKGAHVDIFHSGAPRVCAFGHIGLMTPTFSKREATWGILWERGLPLWVGEQLFPHHMRSGLGFEPRPRPGLSMVSRAHPVRCDGHPRPCPAKSSASKTRKHSI